MRFESPVTEGGRVVTEALDLPSGERIPAGTNMSVCWAAANLDPAYFPEPLGVDLRRSPNAHIGFASGFHRCLGSHLAADGDAGRGRGAGIAYPHYEIKPGTTLVYTGNPPATPLSARLVVMRPDGVSDRRRVTLEREDLRGRVDRRIRHDDVKGRPVALDQPSAARLLLPV